MKCLIDANIFLEAQLEQGKSEVCREFLAEVRDGDIEGVLTMFHADTIAVMMENRGFQDKISGFMLSLYMYEGLDVFTLELSGKAKAMMSDTGLSFDDSIAVQTMKELEIEKIVSYDDDFDGLKERTTPEEVLKNTT
ncbi:MAG: type II toxin-antitoxin system VapC family toxin [Candidatus Nanohalobium sp.]